MRVPKLMLALASGGVLLGLGLAKFAEPAMTFADASDRPRHSAPDYSSAAMQFVESGPQDLSPAAMLPPHYADGPLPADYAPVYLPVEEFDFQAEPAWDHGVDDAAFDAARAAAETAAALSEPPAAVAAGGGARPERGALR